MLVLSWYKTGWGHWRRRFAEAGVLKIWEAFLEEVPMKDKLSGGLALPANGARRS